MRVVKIISEHSKIHPNKPGSTPLKYGCKRVEAIVEIDGKLKTRHIDIKK